MRKENFFSKVEKKRSRHQEQKHCFFNTSFCCWHRTLIMIVIQMILWNHRVEAILEQSAVNIKEFGLDFSHANATRMYGTNVTYEGGLQDRFSVLRKSTYWSKDCLDKFTNPQDIVFSTSVPAVQPDSGVRSQVTIEYTWAERVTVGEIFIMLSELSATNLPFRIRMADTGQVCKLVDSAAQLVTGYHSCVSPIQGQKLHFTIFNDLAVAQKVEIAALNIYASQNLLTMANSTVKVHYEGPAGQVYRSMDGDFDLQNTPRQQNNDQKCLVYWADLRNNLYPTLTLDLGKQYQLDAVQVVGISQATQDCTWLDSMHLTGLEISTASSSPNPEETSQSTVNNPDENTCEVEQEVSSLFELMIIEQKLDQVPQSGINSRAICPNKDSYSQTGAIVQENASDSEDSVRYITLRRKFREQDGSIPTGMLDSDVKLVICHLGIYVTDIPQIDQDTIKDENKTGETITDDENLKIEEDESESINDESLVVQEEETRTFNYPKISYGGGGVMPWMPQFGELSQSEDWLKDFFQGDPVVQGEVEECEGMDHPLFVSCDIHEQIWGNKDDQEDNEQQSDDTSNGSTENDNDTEGDDIVQNDEQTTNADESDVESDIADRGGDGERIDEELIADIIIDVILPEIPNIIADNQGIVQDKPQPFDQDILDILGFTDDLGFIELDKIVIDFDFEEISEIIEDQIQDEDISQKIEEQTEEYIPDSDDDQIDDDSIEEVDESEKETPLQISQEIVPKFKDFSLNGELEIKFEPPEADVPSTWAALWDENKKAKLTEDQLNRYETQINEILKVDFIQNSDEEYQSSFYNTLLEFTQTGIKIKVGFGDPLLVSQGEEPDKIRVRLLKNFFTQTKNEGGETRRNMQISSGQQSGFGEENFYHIYIFDAPKQVRGQDEMESIEQARDIAKNFMFSQFVLAVLANVALTGTLTQLWNIFNTMQLISALPSFAVKTPTNVAEVHQSFDEIVNFEIISKEELYDWLIVPLFGFSDSEELLLQEIQMREDEAESGLDSTAINMLTKEIQIDGDLKIGEAGEDESSIDARFKGSTYMMNILLFVLALMVGIVILVIICVCQKFMIPHCCKCGRNTCQMIMNKLMYNSVIRGLLESYFFMSIAAVYQVRNTDFTKEGYINFGIAVFTLIYLILFPILSLKFLLKNKERLEKAKMQQKYGSLYQNVDPRKSVNLRFTSFFCARRFVFALIICLLTDSLALQILIADFSILAMLAFYTCNLPMKDLLNNIVQIANELAILLLLQFLFLLTDFIPDPVDRHELGYAFLYYVIALISLNLLVLCFSIFREARKGIQKCTHEKRNKKRLAQRQMEKAQKDKQLKKERKFCQLQELITDIGGISSPSKKLPSAASMSSDSQLYTSQQSSRSSASSFQSSSYEIENNDNEKGKLAVPSAAMPNDVPMRSISPDYLAEVSSGQLMSLQSQYMIGCDKLIKPDNRQNEAIRKQSVNQSRARLFQSASASSSAVATSQIRLIICPEDSTKVSSQELSTQAATMMLNMTANSTTEMKILAKVQEETLQIEEEVRMIEEEQQKASGSTARTLAEMVRANKSWPPARKVKDSEESVIEEISCSEQDSENEQQQQLLQQNEDIDVGVEDVDEDFIETERSSNKNVPQSTNLRLDQILISQHESKQVAFKKPIIVESEETNL